MIAVIVICAIGGLGFIATVISHPPWAASNKPKVHYICAGDSIPGTFTIKPGESISFPDHCAYDWQGGEVATAGGGKQILFAGGR